MAPTRDITVRELSWVKTSPWDLAAQRGRVACCIFGHKPQGRPAVDFREGEVALRVLNHTSLDVVVYLVHDGVRTRVGSVTAASSTAFFLPVRSLSQGREIRLFGDPIGGRDHAETEPIVVQPGQQIEWTLEPELRRSTVAVY